MPPAPTPTPGPIGAGPLHPADYALIAYAATDLRRVRRAERVAGTSGWLVLLGGLTALPMVIGSGVGVAFAAVLVVLGWRELSLRRGLRELEPQTAGQLARNQLALGAAVMGYALVQLFRGPPDMPGVDGQLDQMPELAAGMEGILRLAHAGLYAGLIVGAVVMQGSQAAYYARVGAGMRRAYARHPVWVMRVHAAAWAGRVPVASGAQGADNHPDDHHPIVQVSQTATHAAA